MAGLGGLGVLLWLILIFIELRSRTPPPRGAAISGVRIGWTGWIGRLTWMIDFRQFPTIEARRTPANVWCVSFGPFRIAWERRLDVLTQRTMMNLTYLGVMIAEARAERREARLALYAMRFGADEPVTEPTK
jgi:hypothetical protein